MTKINQKVRKESIFKINLKNNFIIEKLIQKMTKLKKLNHQIIMIFKKSFKIITTNQLNVKREDIMTFKPWLIDTTLFQIYKK